MAASRSVILVLLLDDDPGDDHDSDDDDDPSRLYTMAGRPDPRHQEGMYPSSSPSSSDPHDPFSGSQGEHVYYDNESEHEYGRGNRDTYGSDSSNVNDDDRYYDQSGGYDVYGREHNPPCCRLVY